MIKAILAHGLNGEIGKDNQLLWSLLKDLNYFKEQTLGNIVIMGNNTFKSLGNKPLKGRDNRVLTSEINPLSKLGYIEKGGAVFHNKQHLESCIKFNFTSSDMFLIGGTSIYEQFWKYVEEVHITTVKEYFPEADTFFKPDLSEFEKVGEEIDMGSDTLEAFVQVWRRKK